MKQSSYSSVLERIEAALAAAREIFDRFTPGKIETEYKSGHDPVTEADRALDSALRKNLLRDGEGWLSEESADDLSRLDRERVWVVDPLDGTREFVQGIPEFCVSIAMVESGRPVAAGICNPATNETFIGAIDCGLTYNGAPARASQRRELQHAIVLASRSETKRGEWKQFADAPFKITPMGSVAYKLARVSAGFAVSVLDESAAGFPRVGKPAARGSSRQPELHGIGLVLAVARDANQHSVARGLRSHA